MNLAPLFSSSAPLGSSLEVRYKICRLELLLKEALARGELSETEFPTLHLFSPGKYTRCVFLPKGSVLTGKLHRHAHPNKIHTGKVMVVTELGGREILTAPHSMTSPPATKRAIYAYEDTIWTVEHFTNLTSLEEIEEAEIAESYSLLGLEDPMIKLTLSGRTAVEP